MNDWVKFDDSGEFERH